MKKIVILLLGMLVVACAPKIRSKLIDTKFSALAEDSEVVILQSDENLPQNSDLVGEFKVGDSGLTLDCGYLTMIENAKSNARKSGANIIQISELKSPNLGSTCYRLKGNMYRNLNENSLNDLVATYKEKNKSRLPADSDFAVVHFYRPKSYVGAAIGYKIRLDDETEIGRVRNGEKFQFKTSNFGKHTFWAKTESRDSVVIDVQKGQEYFVRCGITMGVAVGKPEILLTENYIGQKEFNDME